MKSRMLAIASVLAILGVMVGPGVALAAGTDTVAGSFTTNANIPAVTVNLYDAVGSGEVASMTPGTAYTVKVNVNDPDGKANLNTITLKAWYDSDGGSPSSGEFESAAADVQAGLIVTWTDGGTFVLTGPGSSTWALGSCVAPGTLPGDFEFKFTVGKVATETTGSANWQIAAKVLDEDTTPNNIFAFDSHTTDNDMNWYGEVAVSGASVNWGSLAAGQDFAEGDPDEENVGSITYVSNGAFNKVVSTTATWSTTATLDEDGVTLAANNFSLRADDDDTLADAAYVTTTGGTIGSGTQTLESPAADANNGLWIKLWRRHSPVALLAEP